MTGKILTRVYPNLPIDKKEVLRYAYDRGGSAEVSDILESVIEESHGIFTPKVCYCEFDIKSGTDGLDLGFTKTDSAALAKNLSGCEKIILFAATVGSGVDRIMSKYEIISPIRALLLQALGTERIEALADAFCNGVAKAKEAGGFITTPRFSPGYADLPLALQRDIFRVLDCPKKIGLTLNESLIMSPTKSITAIIGLKRP